MLTPPILGALAVICYAAFMLLNPLKAGFRAGWRFAKAWPSTWFALGLAGAHHGWWLERKEKIHFEWPHDFSPVFASELFGDVVVRAGTSVAQTLALPLAAEPLSVILALVMFLNMAGTGMALKRGCDTAFRKHGLPVFIALMASAAANVAALAVQMADWLPAAHPLYLTLHFVGLPWVGATAAFALGWLIRLAETHLQAPEEILQIQWPGSAAGRIPRLWPQLLAAAAVTFLAGFHFTQAVNWLWRILGWALAIATAFLPLLLVHWRGEWTWNAALKVARHRFYLHFPKLLLWVAVAFTHFFLYHLAHDGIASGLPANSIWRLSWDFLCALLHAALLVWLLAAWVALQPKFQIPKSSFAERENAGE